MIYGTVLCLGDSLTYGARSEYIRGYPEELSTLLTDHYKQNWSCINDGVCAETSTDILRRAFKSIHFCGNLPGPKIGCLLVGTNDSKNPNYPQDFFRDNMQQIINIFKRYGIRLLIGTLPPVRGDEMPCFFTKNSNEWIENANKTIINLSEKNNLPLIDFRDMAEYLIDGVHLNYDGYKVMAERWFNKIKEL